MTPLNAGIPRGADYVESRPIILGRDHTGIDGRSQEPKRIFTMGRRTAITLGPMVVANIALCGISKAQETGLSLEVKRDLPFLSRPPEPVQIPRRALQADFAVTLLRSGYETADSMDFVPMDKFQQEFWLTRRAEWEPYKMLYDPIVVEQGKIADPLYFDFISAMQFSTLSNEMRKGNQVFKEYCDECEDSYRLITRDPSLMDNAKLPSAFYNRLGAQLLLKLMDMEDFRDMVLPSIERLKLRGGASSDVLKCSGNILEYFVGKGYAIGSQIGSIDEAQDGSLNFRVKSDGPAALWALQYCSSHGSDILPLYDVMILSHVMQQCGKKPSCSVQWTTTTLTQAWNVA